MTTSEGPTGITTRMSLPVKLDGQSPYSPSSGADGYLLYEDGLKRSINCLHDGPMRDTMRAIIYDDELLKVKFKTAKELGKLHKVTDPEEIEALVAYNRKTVPADMAHMPAVQDCAQRLLLKTVDTHAMNMLKLDNMFNINMNSEKPCPLKTWRCITRVFLTERDGKNAIDKIKFKKNLKTKYLEIRQEENESLPDYLEREKRYKRTLKVHGIDVVPQLFDTEEERVHNFVFSLQTTKYAGWHRDMRNGVLEVPTTIEDAIEVAKDRKELEAHAPTTDQSSRMPVFISESATTSGIPRFPMTERYKRYPRDEWRAMSPDDKAYVQKYNTNIIRLAEQIHDDRIKDKEHRESRAPDSKFRNDNKKERTAAAQGRKHKPKAATLVIAEDEDSENDDFSYEDVAVLIMSNDLHQRQTSMIKESLGMTGSRARTQPSNTVIFHRDKTHENSL